MRDRGRHDASSIASPFPHSRSFPNANPTLDPRGGLCGHRDAHARHRGREHGALADRRGPDTGLTGLQWVVDAYTLALAATVLTAGSLADRFGRRRLFPSAWRSSPPPRCAARPPSDIAMLNIARAVQGIGAAIMFAVSLALLANAFPDVQRARRRARGLRRDDRRLVRGRPAGRRRADQRPRTGAGSSSSTSRSASRCLVDHARLRPGVARPARARRIDWPGQVTLTGGLFLLVLGAAARQRGRLGQRRDPRRAAAVPSRCSARSWPSRRASRSRCCRCGCSATGRSPARRSRRSRSRRRSSPCSSTRRSTCSRSSACRRSRPASSTCPARSLMFVVAGATSPARREGLGPGDGRRRARAGRRRAWC